MNQEELTRVLTQLAAEDAATWESQPAVPPLPPDCPSLPRLYAAVLREDWTPAEQAALQASAPARRWLARIRAQAWYPSVGQLIAYHYAPEQLSEQEQIDICYHLEIDRCRRSLRLLRWLRTASLLPRTLSPAPDWTGRKRAEIARWSSRIYVFSGLLQPRDFAGPVGPAAAIADRLPSEDGRGEARLSRIAGDPSLVLACQDEGPGTLWRITLTDAEGETLETGFAVGESSGHEAASIQAASISAAVPAACRLVLQHEPREACALFAELTEPDDLIASDTELLQHAWSLASPAAIPDWCRWAQTVPAERPTAMFVAAEDVSSYRQGAAPVVAAPAPIADPQAAILAALARIEARG